MNITFLIGNGFDLNLGLATAYSDFVKYYKETDAEKNACKDKKGISLFVFFHIKYHTPEFRGQPF